MFENIAIQTVDEYDAIVIGSGISGGFAAKELTEKGLQTLVLERGRNLDSFPTDGMAPWELPFRGDVPAEVAAAEHAVQRRTYAFNSQTQHHFINDRENPYIEEKPFTWIRGNHVGGRSIMWGRQCYRWSKMDFEANARDGSAIPWPISYDEIAPWYDYAERYVGISGQAEGLEQVPDGQFLPAMDMYCSERKLKEAVEKSWPGERMVTIGRVANLTRAHNGRTQCQYRNQCYRGCAYRAYYSSNNAALPDAMATGNLTLRPHSNVHSIIFDEDLDRAVGVRVVDYVTKEMIEFRAKVIFLCASTLGSAQILLNSKTPRFSDGLANSSGAVGHYLMDHHYQIGAVGMMEGMEDEYYYGRRPNGIYIPRFRNLPGQKQEQDFIRGYGFQGGGSRVGWTRGTSMSGFGADLKNSLRTPGPWSVSVIAFGEALPYYDNHVSLDPDQTDEWGIPLLRINCEWKENEFAMRRDMEQTSLEMLEAAGAYDIQPYNNHTPGGYGAEPGLGIHEMGTARMGDDPNESVLNKHNQAHDVPNLFITDGSCMTSAACQNPSITYMALTARAVDYAVNQMKNGAL
ncbi:MAG: GMC family oxidoreductase [Rhodothermales bacterium]